MLSALFYGINKVEKAKGAHALKLPARASIYYFLAAALTKGIGILTTPIFTRILTPDGYGEYTLYMSWLGFLSLCVTALASGSQGYAGLRRHSDKRAEYVSSLLGLTFGFCGTICILLFAFSAFLRLNFDLVLILSLQLFCDSVLAVSYMKSRYSYSFTKVCAISLTQAVLSPVIGLMLIRGAGLGYYGRIYGLLLSSLIVALPTLGTLLSAHSSIYNRDIWRSLARRYLPLLPNVVSHALSLQTDRFVISAVMGVSALAKYSVAHSIGAALSMIVTALGSAMNPWLVRKLAAGEERVVSAAIKRLLYIIGMASVLIVVLSPEAMELLAPEKYSDSLPAVPPLALVSLPSLVVSLSSVALIYNGNEGRVSLAATVTAVLGVALGFILIPVFGYFGAGLAHLLAQTAGALIIIIFLRRSKVKNIFDISSLLWAIALTLMLCALAYAMREGLFVRGFAALAALSIIAVQLFKSRDLIRE